VSIKQKTPKLKRILNVNIKMEMKIWSGKYLLTPKDANFVAMS
jgi:hypothetical protein